MRWDKLSCVNYNFCQFSNHQFAGLNKKKASTTCLNEKESPMKYYDFNSCLLVLLPLFNLNFTRIRGCFGRLSILHGCFGQQNIWWIQTLVLNAIQIKYLIFGNDSRKLFKKVTQLPWNQSFFSTASNLQQFLDLYSIADHSLWAHFD